jgi:hypothetical protein
MSVKQNGTAYLANTLFIVGLLMMLAALGLTFLHLIWWLRFGTWPEYSTMQLMNGLGLPYPHVRWIGVQKVIDFILRSWATIFLFFGGIGVAWLGAVTPGTHRNPGSTMRAQRG